MFHLSDETLDSVFGADRQGCSQRLFLDARINIRLKMKVPSFALLRQAKFEQLSAD